MLSPQLDMTGASTVKPCASNSAFAPADCRHFMNAPAPAFFGLRELRHRVDDRRMRILRKRADDPDARFGRGVGLVDDAERRLAGRHELQRGANILGLRDPVLDRGPEPERFQRGLAVFSGRHRLDVAHGKPAVAKQAGQVEARADAGLRTCESAGATSTMRLPSSLVSVSAFISSSLGQDTPSSRGRPR